jgi:hypothetical protein
MARSLAAFAVLGVALLLSQNALAQSAMCVEPSFGSGTAPALRGGAMPIPRTAAQPDAPAPLHEEDLPWCTGADDPRCAPLHGDSSALRLALRQPLSAATSAVPASTSSAVESEFTPRTGLVPNAGVCHRVERPPRPAR